MITTNYDEIYMHGLDKILEANNLEFNQRKNTSTYRYFDLNLRLNNLDYLPLLNIRKMFPKTIAAELAWTLLGTQSTEFIKKYSGIWNKFEDSDGIVGGAYGYRWKQHFGVDQINNLITDLKKDKACRHGVVITWDPGIDTVNNPKKFKNSPCPYTFVVNIIDNKLNLHVTQRSCDMLVGVPYDIAMYGLLKQSLASSLKVGDGDLSFSLIDAHIYEELKPTFYLMQENLQTLKENNIIPFQKKINCPSIEEIISAPDDFVQFIIDYTKDDYHPIDNIKPLKVIQ